MRRKASGDIAKAKLCGGVMAPVGENNEGVSVVIMARQCNG